MAQVIFREFCEIYKNTFFTEHLRTTAFNLTSATRTGYGPCTLILQIMDTYKYDLIY